MQSQKQHAINHLLEVMQEEERERPAIRSAGLLALTRLVQVAKRDSGQSEVLARFLLSLYNGVAYPFPLTDLRKLDKALYQDCMAVLALDYRPEQEVHTYLADGEQVFARFKQIWQRWHSLYH